MSETKLGERESWGTKWGLVLAAAGNAIGIGNLLRFPAQAGQNGGGAFMIPYVVSLLLFGLPMMWVAWTVGRMGGRHGHGTMPGIFSLLWRHRAAKYVGVIGLVIPLGFCFYYTYIESWCLGYAWFSLTRDYVPTPGHAVDLRTYYQEYVGTVATHSYFPGFTAALTFGLVTIALNVLVLYRGVARGIELLAKIAMPLLFLFCAVLVVRTFSLEPMRGSVWDGLAFLWTPKLSALVSPKVWLAAAGQIFFTLSIGFAALEVYASYLKEHDDVALTGLTTVGANEFVEVIFGSLIAIPACAVFFGADQVPAIASSGNFAIGMIAMPEVLRSFPGVEVFGTIWFLLLFFAAFTSSVAVAQPVMAFFQDEAKLPRGAAAMIVGLFWLLGTLPCVYFNRYGTVDELDFWAGTIGLVVFAIVESILFAWVFGLRRGWQELHRGARMRVPRIFRVVLKFVTPVLLLLIFFGWFVDAIASDQLVPAPRIQYTVEDRARFGGSFDARPVPGETSEARADRDRALDDLRKRLADRVTLMERDLMAWATVELDAEGRAKVLAVDGDPHLCSVLDEALMQRWLDLEGFHYLSPVTTASETPAPGDRDARVVAPMQDGRLRLLVEGVHRSPYIWLIRLILLGMTGAFLLIVHAVWRRRAELGAGEATPSVAASTPAQAIAPKEAAS